jgi:uncharacterized membrane protein
MRGTLAAESGTSMGHTLTHAAIGAVAFTVLDGVWLGLLMKNFDREQLARSCAAAMAAWPPTGPLPSWCMRSSRRASRSSSSRAATVPAAAACGALFGLVVYGVYDFTNYSTLRQWPFVVTLADVAWGTFATAACAAVVRLVVR